MNSRFFYSQLLKPHLSITKCENKPCCLVSLRHIITTMSSFPKITITARVAATIEHVWKCWTTPEDIIVWNAASDDWHTPRSTVDLRVGGVMNSRMEARDGSMGFDFEVTFTRVERPHELSYIMGDQRQVHVTFHQEGDVVLITETFDAESEHPLEMQEAGWQSILNNFKKHTEATAH